MQYVHLSYLAVGPTGFPLVTAVINWEKRNRALTEAQHKPLGERRIALHTQRELLLPVALMDLNRAWDEVRPAVQAEVRENARTRPDAGARLSHRQNAGLLLRATAVLVHWASTLESLEALVVRHERTLRLPADPGFPSPRRVTGLPTVEQELLENVRGRLLHDGAPWLGFEVDDRNDYWPTDLLLLAEPHPNIPSGIGFARLSRLHAATLLLGQHVESIETALVARIDAMSPTPLLAAVTAP